MTNNYTMLQAAKALGVHKLTLYRWEKQRKITPAKRVARNNERVYTDEDIERIRKWKDEIIDPGQDLDA